MLSNHFTTAGGVRLHYRDNGANAHPPLLLLHSLSDNSHAFDAIVASGLDSRYRILALDLRGRGISDRPHAGYDLKDHCEDLVQLLDNLGIEKTFIAGHSFGGLLGLYFAAHHPHRVQGLCMIDAAVELNPLTPAIVLLMTDRLGKWYPSEESYVMRMRAAPFVTRWDDDMRRAFLADTLTLHDGSVMVQTQKLHIAQCAAAVQKVSKHDWRQMALRVPGPALVLRAKQAFINGQHIVMPDQSLETAVLMPGGEEREIDGNHLTMLFGQGAKEIADAILERFVVKVKGLEPVAALA